MTNTASSGASLQMDTANCHTFTKTGINKWQTMLTNLRLGDILGVAAF